jgi:ubiquitin carboxyl-terminal hydrolase 8
MPPPPSTQQLASTPFKIDQAFTGNSQYTAYAIIEHLGTTLNSGHYIAYVHDRPRGVWREYNDARITDHDEANFSRNPPRGTFMIFYERVARS